MLAFSLVFLIYCSLPLYFCKVSLCFFESHFKYYYHSWSISLSGFIFQFSPFCQFLIQSGPQIASRYSDLNIGFITKANKALKTRLWLHTMYFAWFIPCKNRVVVVRKLLLNSLSWKLCGDLVPVPSVAWNSHHNRF